MTTQPTQPAPPTRKPYFRGRRAERNPKAKPPKPKKQTPRKPKKRTAAKPTDPKNVLFRQVLEAVVSMALVRRRVESFETRYRALGIDPARAAELGRAASVADAVARQVAAFHGSGTLLAWQIVREVVLPFNLRRLPTNARRIQGTCHALQRANWKFEDVIRLPRTGNQYARKTDDEQLTRRQKPKRPQCQKEAG